MTRSVTAFLLLHLFFIYNGKAMTLLSTDSISSSERYGSEITATYGFLIAHRDALLPLQQSHLTSLEGSFFRTSDGSKAWERSFLLPEKGIHVSYIRTGSPDRLGNALAVFPYLDFPLNNRPDRHLWFRYGMGIGYVEHVFNPSDNFKNVAIGSHVNGVIHFGLRYRMYSGNSSSVDIGLQLTHFSNGSIRVPNLGINLPAACVSYRLGGNKKGTTVQKDTSGFNRNGSVSILAATGIKEVYPAEGPMYHAATISATYFFTSKKRHDWGLGTDFFYDNSLSVRNAAMTGDSSKSANFRPGIHGAWRMSISRISLLFNMGFYPYTAYKNDGNFYHRIGLRYDFGKIFACMQLKTHYARADFIEWGLGMNITKNRKTTDR